MFKQIGSGTGDIWYNKNKEFFFQFYGEIKDREKILTYIPQQYCSIVYYLKSNRNYKTGFECYVYCI